MLRNKRLPRDMRRILLHNFRHSSIVLVPFWDRQFSWVTLFSMITKFKKPTLLLFWTAVAATVISLENKEIFLVAWFSILLPAVTITYSEEIGQICSMVVKNFLNLLPMLLVGALKSILPSFIITFCFGFFAGFLDRDFSNEVFENFHSMFIWWFFIYYFFTVGDVIGAERMEN